MNNNNIKYELYWSGYSTKRQHGIAIAIKVENGVEIEEVLPVSPRIIVANVTICCYAPTENDSTSSKNLFYNKLNKQSVKRHEK